VVLHRRTNCILSRRTTRPNLKCDDTHNAGLCTSRKVRSTIFLMQLPDTSSLELFHKEWPVIKAVPYSFAICVFVAALIIWLVIWLMHRERMGRDRHAIEHLEREIKRLTNLALERTANNAPSDRAAASIGGGQHIEVNPRIFQSAVQNLHPQELKPNFKLKVQKLLTDRLQRWISVSDGTALFIKLHIVNHSPAPSNVSEVAHFISNFRARTK